MGGTMMPKPISRGEEAFWLHCKAYGLEPKREYKSLCSCGTGKRIFASLQSR